LNRFQGNRITRVQFFLAAIIILLLQIPAHASDQLRESHEFTLACKGQQVPFTVEVYVDETDGSDVEETGLKHLVVEIGPEGSTPGLTCGVVDVLLAVTGAPFSGEDDRGSVQVEYLPSGASVWLDAKPVELAQLERELPAADIAMALFSSYLAKEGAGDRGSFCVSISRAVATALDEFVAYSEPPERLLSDTSSLSFRNYILLTNSSGSVLTSLKDVKSSACQSYKLRLMAPLGSDYSGVCIPEGFVSFVVVVQNDGGLASERAGKAAAGPFFRHVGIRFGSAIGRMVPQPVGLDAGVPSTTGVPGPEGLVAPETDSALPLTEMILIPEGAFLMGASGEDTVGQMDERPQHDVFVPAFHIDRMPVTNAQFRAFAVATGYQAQGIWQSYDRPGLENHPVRGVSWHDAQAYAKWAGKRLPTEAEWEKAMRGTDGRIYPWGNEFDHGRLAAGELFTVGSFLSGASPYGVLDGAGLVWEWTSSAYAAYPFNANAAGDLRVLRGGAWMNDRTSMRVTARWGEVPDAFAKSTGFRCAMDAGEGMTPVPSMTVEPYPQTEKQTHSYF